MTDSRLKFRRTVRALGWSALVLLATAALADRAGLFAYRGDDRNAFDHRAVRVLEVLDGDTIRAVTVQGSRDVTVRLLGVDAPDSPAAHWSEQAARYTSNRLRDRTVTLRLDTVQTRTSDGHLLAYVYITDGDCLNIDIVRDGQAYADRRSRCALQSLLNTAETDARIKRRGLWRDLEESDMPAWRQQWLTQLRARRAGR
jgi:endonuclease YncB( thermonuclease family)